MKKEITLKEAILEFENRISKEMYNDSVHKIKLMTARDMMVKLLKGE
ncbi:MAG: hypothetical protein ACI914_001403 [Candidatus Marivariicella framensis]|jgi:hypothetical protein|tara:strand:+ start:1815 stop:1955 length:141 start_codon:yes stop_codon:yes gene_type:complete